MPILALVNLVLFVGLMSVLYQLGKREQWTLSRRVLLGLIGGTLFGFALSGLYGGNQSVVDPTLEWINIIGSSYVSLLRMIIMPLILITMIAAVLKVDEIKSLGKIGGTVVSVLIVTTVIAALIGIGMALVFNLDASDLTGGARELARAEVLEARRAAGADYSVIGTLSSLVPQNIFADLAGSRPLSIIGVVVFGLLFGIAAALVGEENAERGAAIRSFVDTTQAVIMRLVKLVISLTPYGVLALMTRVIVTTDGGAIINLISFVAASYIAIGIMFVVHGAMIGALGGNVRSYFQKVWPVLTFAFVTRSSAATIPLTIRAQIEELNVPAPIANIAASFGATIGQNGCAGIYPAMLAAMVAPSMGVEINVAFIVQLLIIVAIGSFGIAGVGGGATNAALVVLPAMGFPVTIAALLISIEPLIDMARTALNVNGSITAGIVTSKVLGSTEPSGHEAEA
jgi:L-cystine uptake protein TcyP (sodium:dicarboxylate symporter family)